MKSATRTHNFVLEAFSDDQLILLEKENSTLYQIDFSTSKIQRFSFDQVIDPIADLHISFDKTIQLITQYKPTILRFDRLLNIIETLRLPSAISEANAFYELKTGMYLILSQSQKKLFIYRKSNQSISETIESGTYPNLQFSAPDHLISYKKNIAVTDGKSLHLFNTIPNYLNSVELDESIISANQMDSHSLQLTGNGQLYYNDQLLANQVKSMCFSRSFIFYLTHSLDLHRFAIP